MKRTLACLALALAFTTPSYDCCSVTGSGFRASFFSQANIIVWDPRTQTEHFIRNATFASDAKDLGFIAPTPSKPDLAEADADAFKLLSEMKPKRESSGMGCSAPTEEAKAASSDVRIVQIEDVAGFRAITVLATDAEALSAWMKENGYVDSPTIREWTAFYIKKGWYLTLFKVLKEKEVSQTGLVRMSFKTDRPFNPYLVPKDNASDNGRGLALYFVAPGEFGFENQPAKDLPYREWIGYVPQEKLDSLGKMLAIEDMPNDLKVSAFVDPGFPNVKATDDLYFKRVGDGPQEPMANAGATIALSAAAGGIVAWFAWRAMNKKAP